MYVVDFANSKIFSVDAGNTWAVIELPAGNWPVNQPGAIGFTFDGKLLVTDYANNTVLEYDSSGTATTVLTSTDGISGPYGAGGIAIGPGDGDVFITNLTSGEILEFDKSYGNKVVFADGSDGLVSPDALAFLPDGDLLVADRSTNQIVQFDSVTGLGTVFDILPHRPIDIAIRDNKDVYVLDQRGYIFVYPGADVNSMFLLGVYSYGDGAIAFNADQSTLYHTNPTDSAIRAIDPVTGVAAIKATIPGKPTGLAVVGCQYAPGTFIEFGIPLAGTGGVVPLLQGHGEPRIGNLADVELHDFLGGAPVIVFVSLSAWKLPFLGGEFYPNIIDPAFWVTFPTGGVTGVAGDGDLDLTFLMPDVPFLVGTRWYVQAVGIDAGAVQGASFTRGLTIYVGE